jgi:GntR family transcriptional regulator
MAEAMYVRIADDLRGKIKSGKLKPGTQLPTEQGLQEEYAGLFGLDSNVSRNTVRDAIDMLVREGRVEKRPGQGTFILKREEPFLTTLSGDAEGGETNTYLSAVTRSGGHPENTPPRVEIHPSSRAPELRLPDDEQVLSRHQARYIDGRPYSLQTSFYPMSYAQKAPRLLSAGEIEEGTIKYIADRHGIKQAGWRDEIQVRLATSEERDFFDLPPKAGVPVIEQFRTAFDDHERPIRLTVTVYAADRNRLAYESAGKAPAEAPSGRSHEHRPLKPALSPVPETASPAGKATRRRSTRTPHRDAS